MRNNKFVYGFKETRRTRKKVNVILLTVVANIKLENLIKFVCPETQFCN